MASRSLSVNVTGDSRDYERALARASAATGQFGKRAEHVNSRMGTSFAGMAKRAVGAGAAFAGAYASIAGAKNAIATTEDLAQTTLRLSKNFGLTVTNASEWAAVAKSRDIDGNKLTMGFKGLSTAIRGANQDSKAQIAAFNELGISTQTLHKHGNDLNFMLGAVSNGLAKLPAGTERSAIQAKLFGRTWQTLSPLLREGNKHLEEQLKLAQDAGATFGGKSIKSLEGYIKAQREARLTTLGLQVAFGTELAPVLTKVIGTFSTFVRQMRDGSGAGGRFAKKMGEVWASLKPIVSTAKAVGEWLAKHPGLLKAAGAAWVAYKTVALIQLAQTKLAMIGIFGSKSTRAAETAAGRAGARAGRAYKTAFVVGATVGLYNELVGPFNSILERITGQIDATDPTNGEGQRRADERSGRKYGSPKNQPSNAPRLQKTDPKYLPKIPRKRRGKSASVRAGISSIGKTGITASVVRSGSNDIAATIIAVGRQKGASDKQILAALEAGIVESGLQNLSYGDRDSVGVFQQRPSQGWTGLMNVPKAAAEFFDAAMKVGGAGMSAGQLAQAVQRSAFPGRYDEVQARAMALLGGSGPTGGGTVRSIVRQDPAAARRKALAQAKALAKKQADLRAKERQREREGWAKVRDMIATGKRARRVDPTLENPWLQAILTHTDNLVAAGQLSEAQGNALKSGYLSNAIPGLRGEDKLVAQGMIRDLAPAGPDAVDSVSDEGVRLARIDAHARAGDITDQQAHEQKIASIQDALDNWVLTDDARLELRAQLADEMKASTAAQEEMTAALKANTEELKRQTDFATSVAATEAGAMSRWVTEVISKQMGFNLSGRALTPAWGVARRS